MPPLHGPYALSSQRQIKLPAALARELRIEPGDTFYWRRSDDDSDTLLLVPQEVVERRYEAGKTSELGARQGATELANKVLSDHRLPRPP